ncbi:MAG: hypothetical protein M1834_007075 [Cirrosporium novae-zelandiae]|nr:MAG: hypothetical protein M1834_007075 [Cirrosporium novae-zelandiae]
MKTLFVLILSYLAIVADSSAIHLPRKTACNEVPASTGISSRPTGAGYGGVVDFSKLLKKRQSVQNTCGWLDGLSETPVTCPLGEANDSRYPYCAHDLYAFGPGYYTAYFCSVAPGSRTIQTFLANSAVGSVTATLTYQANNANVASKPSTSSNSQISTTKSSPVDQTGQSTNIGAIVGGTVGGLAVFCIAIIILAVLFRKHHTSSNYLNPTQQPQSQDFEYPPVANTSNDPASQPLMNLMRQEKLLYENQPQPTSSHPSAYIGSSRRPGSGQGPPGMVNISELGSEEITELPGSRL